MSGVSIFGMMGCLEKLEGGEWNWLFKGEAEGKAIRLLEYYWKNTFELFRKRPVMLKALS